MPEPRGIEGSPGATMVQMAAYVAYRFGRETLVDWRTWSLMALAWLALWRKVDLLVIVGVGAALSLMLF